MKLLFNQWIHEPFLDKERGLIGLGVFSSDPFTFPFCTYEAKPLDFIPNVSYDLEMWFYCQHIIGVYKDRDDYYSQQKDGPKFSHEFQIDLTLFPKEMGGTPDDAISLMGVTVKEITNKMSKDGLVTITFLGTLRGLELPLAIEGIKEENCPDLKPGMIISGHWYGECRKTPSAA